MERKQILKLVLIALFAALISAGAYIKIPVGPVPITLSTFFAILAGTCLPLPQAAASIIVYILIGAIGLPVFTSGGGIAAIIGPTGGYIIGYIPCAVIGALIMRAMAKHVRLASLISSIAATAMIYAIGLPWLSAIMDLSLSAMLAAGLIPFIIGDTLKIIVATLITPSIRGRIGELLEEE